MIFAMILITTWAAAMMEGTVVDVTLIRNTAQSVDALTQTEAGEEQLVHQLLQLHQLLPSQVCQQLMNQVNLKENYWCFYFAPWSNFKE